MQGELNHFEVGRNALLDEKLLELRDLVKKHNTYCTNIQQCLKNIDLCTHFSKTTGPEEESLENQSLKRILQLRLDKFVGYETQVNVKAEQQYQQVLKTETECRDYLMSGGEYSKSVGQMSCKIFEAKSIITTIRDWVRLKTPR